MAEPYYFQWQNPFLVKKIYPMREAKLRDFLVYYEEIDRWAEYKSKDVAAEIPKFLEEQRNAALAAFKTYLFYRNYFLRTNVQPDYISFRPIDQAELTKITNLHTTFKDSWPRDIRGERDFVNMELTYWLGHRKAVLAWITSRKNRLANMDPTHPKFAPETEELKVKETVGLPMVDQELKQLRAFLATYDKVEARKLEWFNLKRKDPNYAVSEADYFAQPPANQKITNREIAAWHVEQFKASLEGKDQFALLELIYQRIQKNPKRYPLWLQYMTVHFSGMRYATAHASWADPRELLIRIRSAKLEEDLKKLDAAAISAQCAAKVAQYAATSGAKPKLALAPEKLWKDKVAQNLTNMKSPGPGTQRYGLTSMLTDELRYDLQTMPIAQVLDALLAMKSSFPAWAWKKVVMLTQLRVTQANDDNWDKLTPEEESAMYAEMYKGIGKIVADWENFDITGWREEHGRSSQLIVTRAVCNETAEHIQHLRGHLPPGGLTPKPEWYLKNATEKKILGTPPPSYVKPTVDTDYHPGASILWLRFVNKEPDESQVAHPVASTNGQGLIPAQYLDRRAANTNAKAGAAPAPWNYRVGDVVMRSRPTVNEKNITVNETQYLRWIHEATVVEVGETSEGQMMLTFETSLPDDNIGTSSIGMFRKPMYWFLSDGTEDLFNRSFVGYVPEGQVPLNNLKEMLDWNKILRRKVV